MSTQQQTSKAYFKSLIIIYYALIAGQVFFLFIALFLIISGNFDVALKELEKTFLYVILVLFVVCFLGSKAIYKKRLESVKSQTHLIEKMNSFRSLQIIRYALLEMPSFMAIVFYMLTGNYIILSVSIVTIAIFLITKPDKENAITDLELSPADRKFVNDPDSIIAEITTNS